MSASHLLDTSVLSQPLKKRPDPHVTERWRRLGEGAFVISSVCEAEILFGLRKKNASRQLADYDRLLRGKFPVLPVDSVVADAYADLRLATEAGGHTIGDFDLLIGATAIVHDLIVATLNIRHFRLIPGIRYEHWSQAPDTD